MEFMKRRMKGEILLPKPIKGTSKGGQMRKKRKQVNLSVGRGEKSKTGGLTAKGRAKYNRATGSNLKAPVARKVKPGSKAAKDVNLFVQECRECLVNER